MSVITAAHVLRYQDESTVLPLAREFHRVLDRKNGVLRIMEQERPEQNLGSSFGASKIVWARALLKVGFSRVVEVDEFTTHYTGVDAASIRRRVHGARGCVPR